MQFFTYHQEMQTPTWSKPHQSLDAGNAASSNEEIDVISLGRRIRHLRKQKKLTLDDMSEAVGVAPSQLSLIENGKREPKLSLLSKLAATLGVTMDDLLGAEPISKRAALEIELERAQRGPLYQSLALPTVRVSSRLPMDVLEALVGLQHELERRLEMQAATPEEARRANSILRMEMREVNNYYPHLEEEASKVLAAVGYSGGPLSHHVAADIATHLGFSLRFVGDLPHSTRSVTDLKNRRIYLTQSSGDHDPRAVLLQAIGHYVLGHETPTTYYEFLRQRVHTNYFAAALLMPEKAATQQLREAKARKELSLEDLRDAFAVSYETAAHRFTNLATQHLDITTHFQKVHESGIIHKAYENDGVNFPPTTRARSRARRCAATGPAARCSTSPTSSVRSSSTRTRWQAPTGAPPAPSVTRPACTPCPSEFRSRTPSGSAGAIRPSAPSRSARIRRAAVSHHPTCRCHGRGRHGPLPARTRTCLPRCPRARSLVWMRQRCTSSWPCTPRTRNTYAQRVGAA